MVFEKIFDTLTDAGIECYPVGIKEGKCDSNYVVIKDMGLSKYAGFSSQYGLYDMICHVPASRPVDMIAFKDTVKQALRSLYPTVIPTGTETPSIIDDNTESVTTSMEYKYNVKMQDR